MSKDWKQLIRDGIVSPSMAIALDQVSQVYDEFKFGYNLDVSTTEETILHLLILDN